jgi:integrase
MASIFKQAYTKNGERRESKKWYVEYKDEHGKTKRVAGYADKRATEQFAARLEREAAQRAEGLLAPADGHAKRPLAEHVEDYRRYLTAKENCPEHVNTTVRLIKAVVEGCRWQFVKDIEATALTQWLADLRSDRPVAPLDPAKEWYTAAEVGKMLGLRLESVHRALKRGQLVCEGVGRLKLFAREGVEACLRERVRGAGPETSNHYLVAAKSFARWLRRHGRAPGEPLEFLSALNVETDLRHSRRVLTDAELAQFLAAGAGGRPFRGLTGQDRVMVYSTALNTGLRASELGSLSPQSFDLDADPPMVTVEAAYSKHRRKDEQPIRPDVAAVLRNYLRTRPADAPVWPGSWTTAAAEMVRLDLTAAGIPYEVDGEVFDFHALRHQFITAVVRSTPNPKDAQTLARHSTIELTYGRYTHTRLRDVAGALKGLPALPAAVLPAAMVSPAAGAEAEAGAATPAAEVA